MDSLHIKRLGGEPSGFESFTYPRYRPILLGTQYPEFQAERIAVGAWLQGQPVGLAFFSRPWARTNEAGEPDLVANEAPGQSGGPHPMPTKDQRQLLSVMVHPLLRRSGVATRLLAAGEALAQASGTCRLTAMHSSRLQARPAFEALLKKAGWAVPEEFEFRLAGRANWALCAQTDWAAFLGRLQARGYSATDWQTLGDADRAEVQRLVAQVMPEADRGFDPFAPGNKLEPVPRLSVMLRKHGQIVGWIVGSRGAMPDTFHYSYGYVLPEVQRQGWLVAGMRDVCQRQAELQGGQTLSVLETAHANASMRRFMERQLKPYSEWTDARYVSERLLLSIT